MNLLRHYKRYIKRKGISLKEKVKKTLKGRFLSIKGK